MLDRIEQLRLGDPESVLYAAFEGCNLERKGELVSCELVSGAHQHRGFWAVLWKLPEHHSDRIVQISERMGLRWWRLYISATVQSGRIQSIGSSLASHGRYETLDATWDISPQIPQRYREWKLDSDDERTFMHWFHVTSFVSGEGFSISATPNSTEDELRARRINRRCLFSFKGCDGLCELLPDALPLLQKRKRTWGGCTDVPPSKCDLKYDTCRSNFR